MSASEARKKSSERSRELEASRGGGTNEPTATTTAKKNARSAPLFLPSHALPLPLLSHSLPTDTGQPRAHRRRPRRGAHRRHRPRRRLWCVKLIKKKEFRLRANCRRPSVGPLPPSLSPLLLFTSPDSRSPRSFFSPSQPSYKTHHRLRQVHLHAPHDGRLRRLPRAPGR